MIFCAQVNPLTPKTLRPQQGILPHLRSLSWAPRFLHVILIIIIHKKKNSNSNTESLLITFYTFGGFVSIVIVHYDVNPKADKPYNPYTLFQL